MKEQRGCIYADKPHKNYPNSIPIHGLDYRFTGCQVQRVHDNYSIVNLCNLLKTGSKPDFTEHSNFLLGFVYSSWEDEKNRYIEKARVDQLEKQKGKK